MTGRPIAPPALALLVLSLLASPGALAQNNPPSPAPDKWKDTAEFSFVSTAGNAETSTLGFKDKLWRQWARSAFELNAGAVRAEATTIDRTAFGTSTNFTVEKRETSALTAESYFLNGRYDRKITEHFFWFVGGGWDRNRFSGVENRSILAVGVGNLWIDTDRLKFRTGYSVTYTDEKDVAENPNFKANFSGARVSSGLVRKIGANGTFTSDLILDENLDDTKDYRGNLTNSFTAALGPRLALKVSLQWLYDHEPAFKDVDLFTAPPPGTSTGTKVPVQLDDLDTIFTTSLVVNF